MESPHTHGPTGMLKRFWISKEPKVDIYVKDDVMINDRASNIHWTMAELQEFSARYNPNSNSVKFPKETDRDILVARRAVRNRALVNKSQAASKAIAAFNAAKRPVMPQPSKKSSPDLAHFIRTKQQEARIKQQTKSQALVVSKPKEVGTKSLVLPTHRLTFCFYR